jgi:hypothetical protein
MGSGFERPAVWCKILHRRVDADGSGPYHDSMVEYATLLAGTSIGTTMGALATTVTTFLSGLDWGVLSYVLLALLAVRIAFWAFRSQS